MDANALVCYDVEMEEGCGMVGIPRGFTQVSWSLYRRTEVIAVESLMKVRVWDGSDWKESSQDGVDCIDLDVAGRRWEGGVKTNKPFGYGVIYDEEGRKEYEGFMMDDLKVCYGINYYSDLNQIKYVGSYWNGTRFGRGALYDRNGSINYEGLWRKDKPFTASSDTIITNSTESVEIPKKSFVTLHSFILSHWLHSLKRIVIRYKCFVRARFFELDGLTELESIEIGKKSFVVPFDRLIPGRFRVANCPKLQSIRIGHDSFHTFDSFELSNTPSLRYLTIGWRCFYYAPSFSLTGLVGLAD